MSVQYVAGAAIKLLFSLTRKKKLGSHISHAAPQPTSTQTKQNRKTASVVRQCWALGVETAQNSRPNAVFR